MASLYYVLLPLLLQPCLADDNSITTTKFLKDPQALVSTNGTFRLGFFSPDPSSTHRYLGIWFNKISMMTVVWVANRDKPIKDLSGILKISDDGNLQLINGRNDIIWTSNLSCMPVLNSTAQLLDSGNLILLHSKSSIDASLRSRIVWQSFDHPMDIFLPGMRAVLARTADKKRVFLRSWKTPFDPSYGSFSITMGTTSLPQVFIWNNGNVYWKSGPWDGIGFTGGDVRYDSFVNLGFSVEYNKESGVVETWFTPQDASLLLNYKLDSQGTLKLQYWNQIDQNWTFLWSAPSKECDPYAKCGPFGSCNQMGSQICKCLRGFQPKNETAWKKGNWSSGCSRRTQLQCGDRGGKQDVFLRLQKMKLPDNIEKQSAINQDGCRRKCFNNCSCIAYAYYLNIGCMTWSKDLIDTQECSVTGIDLFIRLASSELAEGEAHKKALIITSVAVIGGLVCFLWRWMIQRGKRVTRLNEHTFRDSIGQVELQEPPLFTFEMLRKATNNFQDCNKLGEGGFGRVYKGILKDGKEIAVKRLSLASEQGLVEFMNEVAVMSELQHRNLVRLLGCCIKGDERMLVCEYMRNKSLDAFLFDPQNRELLPWKKRRNIIDGICRGLMYLHRDSRLKIIHRDLTASNILLDDHLNPKISDFGTARIFRGNEDEANTTRVVGTYGYMSPEYTMGQFSEKTDVYSFGVILLEIVSGIRNSNFHPTNHSLTFLGYVWKLWNEEEIVSFIDPTISQPCFQAEIIRCIQVGLLCVQKLPRDRPNISTLIAMLDTKIQLQHPERPAFTEWETSDDQQAKNATTYSISITQGH